MKLTHYWNLFVLLVSSTQLSNGQVSFGLQGTSCEGNPVTLGCMISSFASSAEWKRGDGSVLAVTCSSGNLCTLTSLPIDGVTYSFSGNTSGIYMSTTLPVSEHGINWTCTYSGSPYIYQFELGCSSSGGGSTGLTTGEIVGIVFAVLLGLTVVAAIVLCCILNTRCKFGDEFRDSKWSFTFPPGGKEKVTPESNLGKDKDTPNKEVILNNELKNGISSLKTSPPRSGANQPLKPVNES